MLMTLSDDPTLGECLAADNAKRLAALNRAAASVVVVPLVAVCDVQKITVSDRRADAHRIELVRSIEAGERARVELRKLGITRAAQSEADAHGVSLTGNAVIPNRLLRDIRPFTPKMQEMILLETFVAGFQHHAGMKPEVFDELIPDTCLNLKREPDNPHDKNAIAVHTHAGDRIGYIARKQNKLLADAMDLGVSMSARIDFIDPEEEPYSRVAITVRTVVPVLHDAVTIEEANSGMLRDQEPHHTANGAKKENAQNWDNRLNEAIAVFLKENLASISLLQRNMGIGYTRAATLCEQMEKLGLVGPDCGSEKRDLLITRNK